MKLSINYNLLQNVFYRIKLFPVKWLCRKKAICYLILILIPCCLFSIYIKLVNYSSCEFLEVQKAVSTICDKYQNREALGNLCADLCELNNLKANSCLPNHLGKDVVFQASYYDEPVVMKSWKLNSDDFDQVYYTNEDGNRIHPSMDIFFSMIANTIYTELQINISSLNHQALHVLTKLWTRNMVNFPFLPAQLQNAAMSNIWFLLQQPEYLLMKYYEDMNVFPKIIGTCGPFYVVEFIQPLDNYFLMFYPAWKEDFVKRAELALKILSFLEETEKHFPFLHFCDVKVGHFGLDKNLDVKLLDMDMVFFETSLKKNIRAIQNCTKDQDCSFIDCQASCNTESRKCEDKILDNNFQRVCRNILSGQLVKSYFGLLSSSPKSLNKELNDMLQQCSKRLDDKSAHILASQLKHFLGLITQGDI